MGCGGAFKDIVYFESGGEDRTIDHGGIADVMESDVCGHGGNGGIGIGG
jgi:hypothetical protein